MTEAPLKAERVSRSTEGRTTPAPSRTVPGRLPEDVLLQMERHFNTDFADVRVHPGEALPHGARAMAKGRDVHFAPGAFEPATTEGRGLIAHELTHVVQQRAGRFSPRGSSPTANRLALEAEAEAAARAMVTGAAPVRVRSSVRADTPQYQGAREDPFAYPGVAELDAIASRAFSARPDDPELSVLSGLRDRVRSMPSLSLPPSEVAVLEGHLAELRALLPSWVPVPAISARRAPVQYFTGVEESALVLIAVVLLILAILVWLLIPMSQKEQMIRDLIRALKGTPPLLPAPPKQAPTVKTKPDPKLKPDPKPEPKRPPPLGPDIFPEPDEDEQGCIRYPVGQRGGNNCHNDFAASLSGTNREYRVCTPAPRPLCVDFDAVSRDGQLLLEIKTGYGHLLGRDPGNEFRRAETRARFIEQSENQLEVAERCRLPLLWIFNRKDVADHVNGFVRVPVTHRDWDCEEDH